MLYPSIRLTGERPRVYLSVNGPDLELEIANDDGTTVLGIAWHDGDHEALLALREVVDALTPYLERAGYTPKAAA